jgi:hypothetical protein
MLKSRIFSAVVILSAAFAVPASAEVISEPGNYAFFYPNADLGLGSSRPADAMAAQPVRGGDLSGMRMSVKTHHTNHGLGIKHY